LFQGRFKSGTMLEILLQEDHLFCIPVGEGLEAVGGAVKLGS
jgi:hypothetical protein